MNRKKADIVAGVSIACILLLGIGGVTQLYLTGGPMGSEMDSAPLMAVIGPLFMTLFITSIVGGVYVYIRSQVFTTQDGETGPTADVNDAPDGDDTAVISEPATQETPGTQKSGTNGRDGILDVLPDDERRILEPVIESPGLTQIKVRDRSNFSRSKVSQTITDLEERGLLYRESQGRTYRVYPADDLDDRL